MEIKEKINEAKYNFQIRKLEAELKMKRAINWAKENPEKIAAGITTATIVLKEANKIAGKIERTSYNAANVKRRHEIYDRSAGTYIKCSTKERNEYNRRVANGESIQHVLRDMGLK